MLDVRLAVDRHGSAGRAVQPKNEPHRSRLACTVRTEEAGDDTGSNGEREVVDGDLVAVTLGQAVRLDHRFVLPVRSTLVILSRVERRERCNSRTTGIRDTAMITAMIGSK